LQFEEELQFNWVGHITGMSKKMMNIVLIWDFEVLVFFDF
jgi:hypothetical protein